MIRTGPILLVLLSVIVYSALISCGTRATPTPRPTPTPTPITYSDTIAIGPGVIETVSIPVVELNRVQGQLQIEGGSGNDINFRVVDPDQNVIVNAGRVSNSHGFSFIASTRGGYQIALDNSFSFFSNKVVTYNITVHHR